MDTSLAKPPSPAPEPLGKREQTKVQNRELILEAARQVFAELGYGATTVRDIIRATPLASGTFYNYFKSKEEVFQAIQDDVALAIRPRLREERGKAKTVEEFISGTFRTFMEFVRRRSRQLPHHPPQRRHHPRPHGHAGGRSPASRNCARTSRRRSRKALFPPVDADFLMAAIVGVAFEVGERMVQRETRDPVAAANFATALFMGGVRTLPIATIRPTATGTA